MNPFIIMKEIEKAYNIKRGSICSTNRSKTCCRARWMAMRLIREYNNFSYTEVGEILEKHHSSVMHGIERFNLLVISDEFTRNKLSLVKNSIG